MVDKIFLSEIKKIVGKKGLISGSDVAERKAGVWIENPIKAKVIVRPNNTMELSHVLSLCNKLQQPVVPHGGLTGLVESAITKEDEVVISSERMVEIEEVDPIGRTLTAQSGVKLQTIQEKAEDKGMFFPLDLGARGSCTIGGNASTNAGGNRVIRYGMARELILGLEAVLADGTVISSMNKMLKNNAGYDLKQIFIGSEGTLGIISRVVLRLREKPLSQNTALVAANSFKQVTALLKHIDSGLGGNLTAFEVMWRDFYLLVTSPPANNKPPIDQKYHYYVLIEYCGSDQVNDDNHFNSILDAALEKNLIEDAVVAKNENDCQKLWAIRDDVEQQFQYGPIKIFDVSLPINCMEDYIDEVRSRMSKYWDRFHCTVFGHLADCNLHIITAVGSDDSEDIRRMEESVYEPLRAIRGSVSAEHGIGLEKKNYLSISRTKEEVALMKTLKNSLDPNNILNPGKVFG
ncbi:MAG: FAD-binding oxidoreductase [SAR86 cluster bacterium]|nr:FAD-binding oxidoreductase [SAR86 cluster bacterium]|tara:strand:- start:1697 stop:3082 length:1386 start_codon:yes stop_codon:yes gene_type:complete